MSTPATAPAPAPPARRWWDHAACAGHDPELWTGEEPTMWPEAVAICLECPVSDDCLAEALARQDTGVVRGAHRLTYHLKRREHQAIPLACPRCRQRPARITAGKPTTCRRGCNPAG